MRFAAPDGTLQPDPTRRLPGRGAYTCARTACFERARERGGFSRTLRRSVTVPDALKALFTEE